jgi:hypothetical protein
VRTAPSSRFTSALPRAATGSSARVLLSPGITYTLLLTGENLERPFEEATWSFDSQVGPLHVLEPIELGFLDTPDVALAVEVVGALAYVADGSSGLRGIVPEPSALPLGLTTLGVLAVLGRKRSRRMFGPR